MRSYSANKIMKSRINLLFVDMKSTELEEYYRKIPKTLEQNVLELLRWIAEEKHHKPAME